MVNLQNMVVLPHWLQGSANTLQHLKIQDCANFATLPEWLPSLTALQTLEITLRRTTRSSLFRCVNDYLLVYKVGFKGLMCAFICVRVPYSSIHLCKHC